MSERTSYAPGTPSWVDLGTPDVEASTAFYSALFGWDIQPGPPEAGGYRMCMLGGQPVAGMMQHMSEGQPTAWLTYIATADADATAARVTEAGGSAIVAPMDVMTVGRMAVFTDASSAAFGVWQARDHIGAGRVNEPGALTWNELQSRDTDAAKAFYGPVFGWRGDDQPMGDMAYTTWMLGDDMVAGMIQMSDQWPAEMPPNWLAYFAVQDCDAAVAKVKELGGTLAFGPIDIPIGRLAVLVDPQGAMFAVVAMAAPAE